MLSVAQSDADRANVINKMVKQLGNLKSVSFFDDLVAIVQPTILTNMEKCHDSDAKQQLRSGIETFVNVLPDGSESKTLFTQTLNKL